MASNELILATYMCGCVSRLKLFAKLLFFERQSYLRQRPRKPRFRGRFARGFFERPKGEAWLAKLSGVLRTKRVVSNPQNGVWLGAALVRREPYFILCGHGDSYYLLIFWILRYFIVHSCF
jgi:hypothetical protein